MNNLKEFFQNFELGMKLHVLDEKWFKVIIVLMVLMAAYKLIDGALTRFFQRTNFIDEKKEETIKSIFLSLLKYTSVFGFGFFVLNLYIEDFSKVLAGVGILGLVVGFGAQELVKDIISGIFFIAEKQLQKGDFVKINNTFTGTVEEVGLRVLRIREWSGIVTIVPNGKIKEIQNYNMEKMRVIERFTVSYAQDPEEVFELMEKMCEELRKEHEDMLKKDEKGDFIEPFQMFGLTDLNESHRGLEFAVTAVVKDDHYWEACKVTRRVMAKELYRHNIKMAEQNVRFVTRTNAK